LSCTEFTFTAETGEPVLLHITETSCELTNSSSSDAATPAAHSEHDLLAATPTAQQQQQQQQRACSSTALQQPSLTYSLSCCSDDDSESDAPQSISPPTITTAATAAATAVTTAGSSSVRRTSAGTTPQPQQQQPQPILPTHQQEPHAIAAVQLSPRHVWFSAVRARVPAAATRTAKLQIVPNSSTSDLLLLQKLSRELEKARSTAAVAASADSVRRVALRNSKVRTLGASSSVTAVDVTLPAVHLTGATAAASGAASSSSRRSAKQQRRARPASAPAARPLQDAAAATAATTVTSDGNVEQSAQSPTRHAGSPQRQQQRQHVAGCYGDYCYLLREHSAQQPPLPHVKKVSTLCN
jgi:hypothetical protein